MNLDHVSLTLIILLIAVVTLTRYFIYLRGRKAPFKEEEDEEIQEFKASFDPSSFTDFSLFDFKVDRESWIAPFPFKKDKDWIYTIYLSQADLEDLATITHEITECTIGRLIEKLLDLKKPLFVGRKEGYRLWVHGKNRQYLLEHILATLSEISEIDRKKLEERLSKEDLKEFTE